MALTKNSQIDLNGNEMILDADGDTTITADTDDQIDFKTGGSDRLTIDASGDVGIGTSTINSGTLGSNNKFLEVAAGTASGSGTLVLSRNTSTNNDEIGGIRYVNPNNADDDGLDADGKMVAAISARVVTSDSNAGDDSGAVLTFSTKPEAGNFTERMRILSDGKVGIATTSPLYELDVNGEAYIRTRLFAGDGSASSASIRFFNASTGLYHPGSDALGFTASGAERMRITAGGTVLVGKTALDNTTAGIRLNASGQATMARNGSLLYLNRTTSDGTVIECAKDNTGIGGISSRGGEFIAVGSGDTNLEFNFGSDQVNPSSGTAARDNAIDLGSSSARFDDIYATNGTIQTSDQNEKNTITNSDLGLDFINKLSPKSYKFNGKTRTHYGLIAQDVETVLSDISKSTGDFAGFIKGDISEKQDGSSYRYGLRYGEFIAPLIKALQEADDKIDALTARIETLEGG